MRTRRLLVPAVLTAALTLTSAVTAHAGNATTDEARVRLTGELIKTSVEHRGDRQWFGVRVGDELVPVSGRSLEHAPPHAQVTLDVRAPQSVVAAAQAGRTLTLRSAGKGPTSHRLDSAGLRAASDGTPATSSSTLGAASTAVATSPEGDPLEVTEVVEAQQASSADYVPATRRITYVEVTPRGMTRAPATTASMTAQVAATDSYWREQSRSELRVGAPTIKAPYTSAFACDSDPMKLWNEAISRTGWAWTDNSSLVLKLPSAAGPSCGYGLGSLGDTPNSPGVLHVSDIAAPVLAHELGHNMSMDHANSLVCPSSSDGRYDTATDWWVGCDEMEYGDSLDIMGPSSPRDLPMLSTPQALQHGLLPPSAAVQAGHGTSSVTLEPLSGLEGTRAAVITDQNTNVKYWVEYRTPTARDSSNPTNQDTGVRVLRTSPWSGSVVLDATPTGALDNHVALAVGRTFASHGSRIKITTVSADAGGAVVQIVNTSQRGAFTVTKAPTITGTRGVGKTLTASKGTWSPTPTSYTYRWKRNGASIYGATRPTYTPTSADAGRRLTVSVAAHRTGYVSKAASSASVGIPIYATNRPYLKGTFRSGQTVTVRAGAWTPTPTSYSYQWYRNNVAITGRTGTTYTLASRDKGTRIHVHVTARRSGYVTGAAISLRSTVAG
ncbi:hypothetical protein ASG73_16240 [Janibacter sp. Soil728]|uniref:hypothetical protein n=1 Tax=Janibacter sp. Soil728 TaxID=1736393 RepID=UPI0006FBC9C2|nr:hypothetical protein [Janibacter sp. Soil728]KRE35485.1 hypothetical protein ASG73_16240 [Janibacter sp. Soil728]